MEGTRAGAEAVPKFRGDILRRKDTFSISLSAADSRDVRERVTALGLHGPSEFFRRLISEARGAKLPIVFTDKKAS